MKDLRNLARSGALVALAVLSVRPGAAYGSPRLQVLVAASRPAVTGLEVDAGPGTTVLRLLTEGKLRAPAGAPLSDRFQVLMPGVDLSAVAGSWGAGSAEVLEVRVSADESEGITVVAAAGVLCTPALFDGGLEIACRAPPEPAGEAEPAAAGTAGDAAGPRISLDFRDADLRDVLRVLSEVSGLDFVLQPGVAGRVSLRLSEIPWEQALELVLRVPETWARARGRSAAGGSGGRTGGRG